MELGLTHPLLTREETSNILVSMTKCGLPGSPGHTGRPITPLSEPCTPESYLRTQIFFPLGLQPCDYPH